MIRYQLIINKSENVGLKHCDDLKAFIGFSNDMDDIYENIDEYNPNKRRKILIVLNDKIADMLSNKKPIVTELFIRGRKLNISIAFIMQSYLLVPKNLRLTSTCYYMGSCFYEVHK